VAKAWGHFWNPEEGERLWLEAITMGVVKTKHTEKI
jgi:hypothetical protein